MRRDALGDACEVLAAAMARLELTGTTVKIKNQKRGPASYVSLYAPFQWREPPSAHCVAGKDKDRMLSVPTALILMYFTLLIWLIAGFADWLCHRASHIETTTGAEESLIHPLMFAEVSVQASSWHVFAYQCAFFRPHDCGIPHARGDCIVGRELRNHRPHGHTH